MWCISGSNFQNGRWRGDGSYYFSRYNHCWGWASWRRCWQHYDAELSQWPALCDAGLLDSMFEDPLERRYWRAIWQRLFDSGEPDTWDYQWTFTCLANGGLTALPNRNLVSNVGFGADATHTVFDQAALAGVVRFLVNSTSERSGLDASLQHPGFVVRDAAADRFEFEHKLGGSAMRPWHRRLIEGELRLLPRLSR